MSCKPFKTSEANAKSYLKTQGAIDKFLNIKDLNTFRKENAKLKEQAKTKYFSNVQGWNEKLFFENREGTKAIPNKAVFKQIDNINGIYYSPTEQVVKTEKKLLGETAKETYFKDSDTKKAFDVLTEISKSNHPLNKLAEKLLPYVKANNVDISLIDKTYTFKLKDGTEATTAGHYLPSTNNIELWKGAFNNIEKLILHEVLHSVSTYQIHEDTETNDDFKKLFEHAKENLPNSYQLENIDEFLVGIFTDSNFIKKLQELPAIKIKKYKNFLEEVLDHLLSYLGFKKGTSLYEQAFEVATNILEESRQYSEMMNQYEQYNQQRTDEDFIQDEFLYSPAEEFKENFGENNTDKLTNTLVTYLNNFGITVKDINEIKDKVGIDESGFADILSKIAYIKDKKDLPPVAGKFIAYMMQHNPLISNIIKDFAKANKELIESRNAIYYVASGLGKSELVKKNPNKFADMDELIENAVITVFGKSFGTAENSRLIYEDDRIQNELKKQIKAVMQTKIILSPIAPDKLKLIGFNYKKHFVPSASNTEKIIKGIANRTTNPYSITKEEYEKLYVTPFVNNEKVRNVSIIDDYISEEFKDMNDLSETLNEFLNKEDYYSEDNYKELNKDKYFEIVGKLIAKQLERKVNKKISNSLIDKIKQIIDKFFNLLNRTQISRLNKNIWLITEAIIENNKNFITSSIYKPGAEGKPVSSVSVEKALASDKFGKSIIYKLSKQGFILTGSTALSEQGTILRPDENQLHDIDWVSPFKRQETEEKFFKEYPDAIKVRDIYGEGYITDSFIIAPEGYKIQNYKNLVTPSGKVLIDSYELIDSQGKVVGTYRLETFKGKSKEIVEGVEAKVIDFFVYEDYSSRNKNAPFTYTTKDGNEIRLANWKDIFNAKLEWSRYKDIWDYNRFIPNENIKNQNNTLSSAIEKQIDDLIRQGIIKSKCD